MVGILGVGSAILRKEVAFEMGLEALDNLIVDKWRGSGFPVERCGVNQKVVGDHRGLIIRE